MFLVSTRYANEGPARPSNYDGRNFIYKVSQVPSHVPRLVTSDDPGNCLGQFRVRPGRLFKYWPVEEVIDTRKIFADVHDDGQTD